MKTPEQIRAEQNAINQRVRNAFAYHGQNHQVWAILIMLDAAIEGEIAEVYSKGNKGEDRAFHAGSASALQTFKDAIISLRESVEQEVGINPSPSTVRHAESSESDTK